MKSHATLLLTAAVFACLAHFASPVRADDIDDLVQNDMQARHIPGLALEIVQNGAIVKESAYGLADIDKKTAVFQQTMFEIGPLTRLITATAVLQLVDQGKVSLDDKVSKYVVNPPDAWSDVTVRELLAQTSGIKDCDEVMPLATRVQKNMTVDETLALVGKLPLDFTPGSQWESSNSNYLLLGKIVEKASGEVYGEYVSKEILQPEGMTFTHLANPKAAFPALAKGYALDIDGTPKPAAAATALGEWSAGSIVAGASDLGKWDVALDGGKMVSQASVDEMFKPYPLTNNTQVECCLGWTLRHPEGHNIAECGGATTGFMAHLCRDIDDHIEIVILTNDANVDPMPLTHRILESFEPTIAPDPMAVRDEAVDSYCKGILQKLQDGKLDQSQFSSTLWPTLKAEQLDSVGKSLAALGSLNEFVQTDKDFDASGQPVYTYRCIFGDTAYTLSAGPSTDGKIGHFDFAIDPFDAE